MDRSYISLSIFLALFFNNFNTQAEVKFNSFSIAQALEEAKSQHKKVFVVFSNLECSPCRWMDLNVYSDSLFSATTNENFINVKSNGYTINGKYEVMHYKVYTLPTMIYFDENGKELYRIEGKRDKSKMTEIAALVLNGAHIDIVDEDKKEPMPIPRSKNEGLPINPVLRKVSNETLG
ncbi:MAG: thioredoxin family protein [Bacteroidota bacterium]